MYISLRAMALAVRDRLQLIKGWDDVACAVRDAPGDVPAVAGEFFCAIFEMGEQSKAFDSLDIYAQIGVCLTRRITYSPEDRVAEDVINSLTVGLEVTADEVRALIHGDFSNSDGTTDAANNYAIMDAANNYIVQASATGSVVYGFVEPLRYLSKAPTQKRNGDWFQGDPAEKDVGLSVSLTFGSARKIATLWQQT